jgi:hypothetical protein
MGTHWRRHRRRLVVTDTTEQIADTGAMSGWVLADLLLGLTVILLASLSGIAPPSATPTVPPAVVSPTVVSSTGTPSPPTPTVTRPTTLTPTTTPSPTLSPPTATPTPTPTATPCQSSVRLVKHEFEVAGRPGGGAPADEQLVAAFSRFTGSRVGIVITYGHAPTVGQGVELAERVNATLFRILPDMFTADTITEEIRWEDSITGTVFFQVYLLSNQCV